MLQSASAATLQNSGAGANSARAPFLCGICSEGFKTVGTLKRHVSHHAEQGATAKRQRVSLSRSAPRASQACKECATAKAKCDNEECCQRCRRRNLVCLRAYPVHNGQIQATRDIHDTSTAIPIPPTDSKGSQALDPQMAIGHEPPLPTQDLRVTPDVNLSLPCSPEMLETAVHPATGSHADGMTDGSLEEGGPQSALDFNTSYNLFDLGTNPDFVLSDLDIGFLTPFRRWSPQLEELAPPPATSPICKADSETSQAIFDAFSQSLGRWYPEKQNYRAVEESHLSFNHTSTTKMACLGRWDPSIINDRLLPSTRDKLLAIVVGSCEPGNISCALSAFPDTDVLDRLMKAFFTHHAAQRDTWIHVPTFKAAEARIELVAACIATGAVRSSSQAVQKFGLAILEILTFRLFQASEKANILTRNLQHLQAFALQVHIALWSGIKRKMEMAGSFVGVILNMLRGGGCYRRSSYSRFNLTADDNGQVLETKWRRWAEEESFKRLVHHMHIHCARESLMTHVGSPMAYSELSLPVPHARELWFASSASQWKELYLKFQPDGQAHPPSVTDCLADPHKSRLLPCLYDQPLAQLSLLYSVFSLICQYRQSQTVFSSDECCSKGGNILPDESRHRRLLQILQDIRFRDESYEPGQPMKWNLLLELFSMHLHAPLDQIELVAGREGKEEAQMAYPYLHRWSQTQRARQAVWHAGQVLRSMRDMPLDHLIEFHAVATYHASLCLWIYGNISNANNTLSSSEGPVSSPSSKSIEVFLDGEETLVSQSWININRGVPMISSGTTNESSLSSNSDSQMMEKMKRKIALHSSEALMQEGVQIITSKFASLKDCSPSSFLVEKVCHLMLALGKVGE